MSNSTAIEQTKWTIQGVKEGKLTTFTILAWNHADAVKIATKKHGINVQSCVLFTSKAERRA